MRGRGGLSVLAGKPRVFLVFHDPGDLRGFDIVHGLASAIAKETGLDVRAVPISSIEDGTSGISAGDLVFALLPFRGGHLAQVIEHCKARDAVFAGKIPLSVIVEGLSNRLRGCSRVVMLYWRAKRLVEEQGSDIRSLCEEVKARTGASIVKAVTGCNGECEAADCIAVLSVLPGRLTRAASKYGSKLRVGYLMEAILEDVKSWILGELKSLKGAEAL